jgi:hypothetical protein
VVDIGPRLRLILLDTQSIQPPAAQPTQIRKSPIPCVAR